MKKLALICVLLNFHLSVIGSQGNITVQIESSNLSEKLKIYNNYIDRMTLDSLEKCRLELLDFYEGGVAEDDSSLQNQMFITLNALNEKIIQFGGSSIDDPKERNSIERLEILKPYISTITSIESLEALSCTMQEEMNLAKSYNDDQATDLFDSILQDIETQKNVLRIACIDQFFKEKDKSFGAGLKKGFLNKPKK